MKRKVCVVSSGRADYGLLYWPMREIQAAHDLELQTIVTGMHLSPEFGMTVRNFAKDGFPVTATVDMLLAGDTAVSVTKSLGLGVIGFADALHNLKPDLLILLGDRFEILAAAQAALIAQVPVAHLYGGDTSEGAYDESIRHSITKMSHLHFVSNRLSEKRIIQLGENPDCVYNVGSTGIDAIMRIDYLDRADFFRAIDFEPREKNIMITFHPVTLGRMSSEEQFQQLLMALHALGDGVGLIFTRPNADNEGRILNAMLGHFLAVHDNAKGYDALGELYLSALKHVDAMVGNSSSGLYEAPSFGIASVNIGDRQKGRLKASSVIDCDAEQSAILHAIGLALEGDFRNAVNPYGDGNSACKIVEAIRAVNSPEELLQKHFFMMSKDFDGVL